MILLIKIKNMLKLKDTKFIQDLQNTYNEDKDNDVINDFLESIIEWIEMYNWRHFDNIDELFEAIENEEIDLDDFNDFLWMINNDDLLHLLEDVLNIDIYDWYIQISDRRILWEIKQDIDIESYNLDVTSILDVISQKFTQDYWLNITLINLWRNWRHIVIKEANFSNEWKLDIDIILLYEYLDDIIKQYNKYENEFIKKYNKN